MLNAITLTDVGPAPGMDFSPVAPRVNLLTGDNGLGKSFLLDVAWWALTRSWPDELGALPHRGAGVTPMISFAYSGEVALTEDTCPFDFEAQSWRRKRGKPADPGLVLYARVDGSFSVWDPARYRSESKAGTLGDARGAIHLQADEVWKGRPEGAEERGGAFKGLLSDWLLWQARGGDPWRQLTAVLEALSPGPQEVLAPGDPTPVSIDGDEQPTLRMPYGQDVPLMAASAGMRRICALAYLLVWAWERHQRISTVMNRPVTREIIFLVDELEAHLHPKWQRRILAALLGVMDSLTGQADVPVQLIAATHSPLVLASMEPRFESDRDALWDLDLVDHEVTLKRVPWVRRGDASSWLTSDIFDLGAATSVEAEEALGRARALLLEESPEPAEVVAVDKALRQTLGDLDPFFVRWGWFVEKVTGGGAS
ncbi:MAG: AAA family ATPase [Alphaproteobacteria bacterium]|nr:AAA family ATPase [Alphaproteobacteria bacterium]